MPRRPDGRVKNPRFTGLGEFVAPPLSSLEAITAPEPLSSASHASNQQEFKAMMSFWPAGPEKV